MERKFIFRNFVPSSATHRYCSRKFSQIWDKSPSDSNVSAEVFKTADGLYRTVIQINASRAVFNGEASDTAVLVSIGIAVDKVHSLLTEWKKSRAVAD